MATGRSINAVARVGEVDRPVRSAHDEIVRAVESLAFKVRRQNRFRAVGLAPGHLAQRVFGDDQSTLVVDAEAVRAEADLGLRRWKVGG